MHRKALFPETPSRSTAPPRRRRRWVAVGVLSLAALACSKKTPEPKPEPERTQAKAEKADSRTLDPNATVKSPAPGQSAAELSESHWTKPGGKLTKGGSDERLSAPPRGPKAPKTASVPVSPDDPLHGKFSLADATQGLKGEGALVATIKTAAGKLSCELYEDRAPITVANFVGLARGLRPFKNPEGRWVKQPAYDGTVFHRIVKGFMIQGGDPEGSGKGEPGYVIADEIWEGAKHDRRGLLCMANRGRNTNGMQFFIMDGEAKHLDGGYTIFGECTPDAVIEKLSAWDVVGDRAVNPPKIEKVTIERKK